MNEGDEWRLEECSTDAAASRSDLSAPATARSGTPSSMTPALASSHSDGPESSTTGTSNSSTGPPSSPSSASAPASPVSPSASPDRGERFLIRDGYGRKSSAPFAHFVPATSSSRTSPASSGEWKPTQERLFSQFTSSYPTWPRQATWDLSYAYELLTSAPRMDETDGSQLLPTPKVAADRSSRKAMVENQQWGSVSLGQALEIARGTLPREFASWAEVPGSIGRRARALLPTPGSNDHTGAESETRARRRQDGRTGGPSLRDLPKLLPTPVVTDSFGSRRSTARTEEWESNEGTTLTDAIWEVQGRTTDTTGKLLPTPTTQDGKNNAGPSQYERNSDPLNVAAAKMLPTPSSGESTRTPSDDGNGSAEQSPLDQLTIGDG